MRPMPAYHSHVTATDRERRYPEVAASLRARIAGGEWAAGTRLPGKRRLALEIGIAPGTVDKAVAMLADEGMVEVVPGSGTFVISAEPRPRKTLAERVTDLERRLDRHEQEHGQ